MTDLLGRVRLQLGAPAGAPGRQALVRREAGADVAAALARGRPAQALPGLMGGLHALCAHGHRLAADLAVRAALGEHAAADGAAREALRRAVVRDQMLRIAHDWPRLLPGDHADAPPLEGAPPWQVGGTAGEAAEAVAALPAWLSAHWLRRPVHEMLAALNDDPAREALRWARCRETALARLLARELPPALALRTPERALVAPAPPGPPSRPVPDTGAWSRHRDPRPAHNAGMRLLARLTDLLRLALPDGAERLFVGAAAPAPGCGRAWVEVGRGLLGYEVRLGDGGIVRELRVVSPTDWNFHPAGVLAEALAGVTRADDACRLAVAFDPCVPFEIVAAAEAAHA